MLYCRRENSNQVRLTLAQFQVSSHRKYGITLVSLHHQTEMHSCIGQIWKPSTGSWGTGCLFHLLPAPQYSQYACHWSQVGPTPAGFVSAAVATGQVNTPAAAASLHSRFTAWACIRRGARALNFSCISAQLQEHSPHHCVWFSPSF